MTELGDRLRVLDRLQPPDLWPEIRSREPGPYGPPPSWRRPLAAGVAFAVAAAGIGFAAWAFTRGDSARPAGAPAGRIAFVSDRDGDRDLYVMSPDGTGISNLTENDVDDYAPAWSPDGTRIAFVSERDGNPDVYVINADGTGVTRLTDHPGEDTDPTWSPDGRRIAFTTDRDGNFEIYVMDADGAGLSNLTRDPADDIDAAWSPDGSRIAFARTSSLEPGEPPDVASILQIHVMAADGSGVQRLTELPGAPHNPAWSPDGGRLAFEADGDIYTMNADGSGVTRLAREPPPGAANRHPHPTYGNYEPVWSPDGGRILFVSDRDGDRELYVMDADATEDEATRLVRSPGNESQPTWQPVVAQEETFAPPTDRIVMEATGVGGADPQYGGLFVMAADGSGLVRLNEGEGQQDPDWSPDGSLIVFESFVPGKERAVDLEVVDVDGRAAGRLTDTPDVNETDPDWSPDGRIVFTAEQGIFDDELSSCHMAVVDGYVTVGHVPPADVLRLLRERPRAIGLSVPGMPDGSPGMERPDGKVEAYQTLLILPGGKWRVFARHG